ncbi:MAG: aspartyl protease family protein [Stellaceae bacterium]
MKSAAICIVLVVILGLCGVPGQAAAQVGQSSTAAVDRLFEAGKFAAAGKLYAQIAAQDPKDYSATIQLGRIALLSNRLDAAQKWLQQALALRPDDADAKVMLAEVFYRRDDFGKAAAALQGVAVSSNKLVITQYPTLNLAQLESFKGETPYELHGDGASTQVKFLRTEPLPVVEVRINGGKPVTFFIDTGASEVALDTDFAKELGIPQFGAVQGTFSGGQHAEVGNGRIASLGLGGWTIRNLPVAILHLRQLSKDLGVTQIDGCIGTTLFYHFLATMDFPHGELVLRRKDTKIAGQSAASSPGKRVAVPFWIAGDHFMVGWGRVERLPPTLLFVDTGLEGAGVKLARSVIAKAGIKLEEDKASEGAGGGGTLKIVPYTVGRLSFGGIRASNVAGLYDGPFPWEYTFGFHLAGMVGHDFFKPYAVIFDFRDMKIFME